jgi:hypothetical protein
LSKYQISQAKQGETLSCILGESLVTGFVVLEEIIDDVKWMLDLGTDITPVSRPRFRASAALPRNTCRII